jgi:hypothetical protein
VVWQFCYDLGMSNKWIEGVKLGVSLVMTLIAVINLVSRADVKAFASNGWTWFYFAWICVVILYAIDRYLRIKHVFQGLKADTMRKQGELQTLITETERRLILDRAEWARQLRCTVEDAVKHILQAEAGVRAKADEALAARLKAVEDRLPPVVVR